MSAWAGALDVAGAVCVLAGALLCLAAAIGLLRFPDVLSRMHAATKPQTLGLVLVVIGVELSLRSWAAFGTLVLVTVLQLCTAPVAAHLVGRTTYRSNQVRSDLLVRDELAEDLTAAGFRLAEAVEEPSGTDGSTQPPEQRAVPLSARAGAADETDELI